MALHVISDLHLDDRAGARLFRDGRQGRHLVALAKRILEEAGPETELVLNGDVFDFTSMLPPERGLEAFAKALDFPVPDTRQRPVGELCAVIRESNPRSVEALGELARNVKVTWVPGNHDWLLGTKDARPALDAIGLKDVRVASSVVRKLGGRTVVLEHGHEWDLSNRKPRGLGEVMTRALHNGVIPFLEHYGPRPHVRMDVDRVVALRPEERLIPVLERWVEPKLFRRFFRAFLTLLAENGYLPHHLAFLTALLTPKRVHRIVEKRRANWSITGDKALAALRGRRKLPHGAPRPDVLILGHTHTLDWAVQGEPGVERLYVNLGTWTERTMDASSPPDSTLPALDLREAEGKLFVRLFDVTPDLRELQRFEVDARR